MHEKSCDVFMHAILPVWAMSLTDLGAKKLFSEEHFADLAVLSSS